MVRGKRLRLSCLTFESVLLWMLGKNCVVVEERCKIVLFLFLVFHFSILWKRNGRKRGGNWRFLRNVVVRVIVSGYISLLYFCLRDWLGGWELCIVWKGIRCGDCWSVWPVTHAGYCRTIWDTSESTRRISLSEDDINLVTSPLMKHENDILWE